GDPAFRNSLLLDLNAGTTDFTSPLPSNLFTARVDATLIYGTSETTTTSLTEQIAPVPYPNLFGLTDLTARLPASGETWFQVERTANSGDGLVPALSAFAPFLGDERIELLPLSTGDAASTLGGLVSPRSAGHLALPGNPAVQNQILVSFGLPVIPAPAALNGESPDVVISKNAMTLLHDGASANVLDPDQQSVYTGGATGFGLVETGDGGYQFDLTGTGSPYFVQARSVTGRREGGVRQSDTLADGSSGSVPFDLLSIFDGFGIGDVIELGNPSLELSLDLTISPAGVTIGPGSELIVRTDYAAFFPDTSTETDPNDLVNTLDGLITVADFSGAINLQTGLFTLTADTAGVNVDGVLSATASPVPNPAGGDDLPGISFTYDPNETDPATQIGVLRGVAVDIEALGDDVPSNLIQINEFILRRDGFSLDGAIGDPTAVITLGGADPLVELTGLQGTADVDVTFTPAFRVTGTLGIAVTDAAFLPGSSVNASLSGAVLAVDIATGATLVTADQFTFEIGELLNVVAEGENNQPLSLDVTAALTDPTATIINIPTATITTGLFTDRNGDPVEFILQGLEIRGDGVSLTSASLPEVGSTVDLLLATPGPDSVVVAELTDLAIQINNLSYDVQNGFSGGGLSITLDKAALLPDLGTPEFDGVATATGLAVDLDLQTGALAVTATSLDATLGDFFKIEFLQGPGDDPVALRLTDDPTVPLLDLPVVQATFIGLAAIAGVAEQNAPKVRVEGLQFFPNGQWTVDTVALTDVAEFVFGVADFLPFAVDSISIGNFGQLPGGGVDFNQFDFSLGAEVNWESPLFQNLPFDPYINIGGVEVSEATSNPFTLEVVVESLAEGRLRLINTGPITLGFRNWDVGQIVFEGELTFGGFDQFGQLQPIDVPGDNDPDLAGFIGFKTIDDGGPTSQITPFDENDPNNAPNFDRFDENSSPEGVDQQVDIQNNSGSDVLDVSVENGRFAIVGDIDQRLENGETIVSAAFQVAVDAGVRFKLAELFELYGVRFDFAFGVSTPLAVFAPEFSIDRAVLAVDAVRLTLGGDDPDSTLEFTALGYTIDSVYVPAVEINFLPDPGDPNANPPIPPEPLATFGTLGVNFPDIFVVRAEGTPEEQTDRIGGRVSGLQLLPGFIPSIDAEQGLQIVGEFGDFFSPENQVFAWIPFRVDELGIQFLPEFFARDAQTGAITGIADELAFELEFSGGFVQAEIFEGVKFPLEATFGGLRLDVRNLKKFVVDQATRGDMDYFPIKEINLVSFGLDPFSFFEDSPLKFRGNFALGDVVVDSRRSIFVRVAGEFEFSDWGGGVDLVISDRGPLLAKFNVPMAIPLGQTTLVLSGVEGGIAFGINELRSVEDPLELVRDPVFVNPFDVSTSSIQAALETLLLEEQQTGQPVFTWAKSLTIGLSGSITSVAAAGALSGNATLVANIVWPRTIQVDANTTQLIDPDGNVITDESGNPLDKYLPDLRLFGTGNIALLGMPLGRAGILIDYSNPLAPSLAFGVAAPAPGSPLGFLLPAQAEFGVLLTTDGIYEAPLMAVANLVGSGAIDVALGPIAQRLEADKTRPLAQYLLDTDDSGDVDPIELARTIDVGFVTDRLIGGPSNPGSPLLPVSYAEFPDVYDAQTTNRFTRASRVTTAFINEYLAYLESQLSTTPTPEEVAAAFADFTLTLVTSAANAAVGSWQDFKNRFDPKLLITGRVQPTLLGFPLGTPFVDGTILIDKSGVAIDVDGSLIKILETALDMTTGGIAGTALKYLTLGLEDLTQFHYAFEFPQQDIEDVIAALISGPIDLGLTTPDGGDFDVDLANKILGLVNPLNNWEASLSSEFTLAGLRFANVSGVMFDPLNPADIGPTGTVVAEKMIFPLDADRDYLVDQDRIDALDAYELALIGGGVPDVVNNETGALESDGIPDPLLIPVPPGAAPGAGDPENHRYDEVLQRGGILLTGQVFVPDVLRDPVAVLSNIQWEPPRNQQDNQPYDLSDFQDPLLALTAFGEYSEWIGGIVDALTQVSEYGRMQMYIPSLSGLFTVADPLGTYGPDETPDGAQDQLVPNGAPGLTVVEAEVAAYLDNDANSAFDIGVDVPLLWTAGEPVWDGNGDGLLAPIDGFIDLDGNTRYDDGIDQLIDVDGDQLPSTDLFFDLDRSGAYSAGSWYQDVGNGIHDPGEDFQDIGNGRYDGPEPFTDSDGSGVHDAGEPYTDINQNGQYDAGEQITDLLGGRNGLYDEGEAFVDLGDGIYNPPEPFEDLNGNRVWDTGEDFTDLDGDQQYDAGEPFVDLGNGVYDGPNSVAPRIDFESDAGVLADILGSFYVEGYLDLEMLGIDFGKGYLRLDEQGFAAQATAPWLADAVVATGFRLEEVTLTEAIDTLFDSPLVADVASAAGFDPTGLRTLLETSPPFVLPDFRIAIPVGFLSAELSADGLRNWLEQQIGVPSDVLQVVDGVDFSASLGMYTPRFGNPDDGASGAASYGGVELAADLTIPNFVENAQFEFEAYADPVIGPSRESLPVAAALGIPNFSAVARADLFQLSGLEGFPDILRLEGAAPGQPAEISLEKTGNLIAGSVSGQVTLLDTLSLAITQGDLGVDLNPLDPAIWGDIELNNAGGAQLIMPGYTLSADSFSLQFNSDTVNRPVDIPPGLRVWARNASLTIPGVVLSGDFGLTVDPVTQVLRVDAQDVSATVGVAGVDVVTLGNGTGFIEFSPAGVAGSLSVSIGSVPFPDFALTPGAQFNAVLSFDTTGQSAEIAQLQLTDAVFSSQGFSLAGDFLLSLGATAIEVGASGVAVAHVGQKRKRVVVH
ncbi:MAG: hypothetical protein ACC645_03280, partial [Pirellulales bacterium]